MIKVPNNQYDFIKAKFCFDKKDMPSNFFNKNEFIDMLSGNLLVVIDNVTFIEKCYNSIVFDKKNINKFNKLCIQLNYLNDKCFELEYFELMHNFKIINLQFACFVEFYNNEILDKHLLSILETIN